MRLTSDGIAIIGGVKCGNPVNQASMGAQVSGASLMEGIARLE